MIRFKGDLFDRLKAAGYPVQQLRYQQLLSQSTLSRIRRDAFVSTQSLDVICRLLNCQPGDICEYVPDSDDMTDSLPDNMDVQK